MNAGKSLSEPVQHSRAMPPITTVGPYLLEAAAPGQPCHSIVCGRNLCTPQKQDSRPEKQNGATRTNKAFSLTGKKKRSASPAVK